MRSRHGTRRLKKILLSMMTIGSLSLFSIHFAFGALNTESTNATNSISVGTLTLSDKVGATTCLSFGGAASPANHNGTCSAMFSNTTLMYPGSTATANVTVANTGSLDATLSLFMGSCTVATSPSAPAAAVGGANPCTASDVSFYVEESNSTFTSHACVWPVASASACGYTASTMYYMSQVANTETSAVSLGALNHGGTPRYFIIGISLPTTASNTLQGEEADFPLSWRLS
jgi:hypothetical protein